MGDRFSDLDPARPVHDDGRTLTLERYIFGLLLRNFILLVLVVTGLVFLIGMVQSLGRYDDLNLTQILERLPYVVPSALTYAMPLGLLIAALFTFGRLSADNEITAIRMGGIHPMRILMPAFALGMAVSILALVLNSSVTPLGLARARAITKDDLRKFLDHLEASSRVEFTSERLTMKWLGVDQDAWIIEPQFEIVMEDGKRIRGAARRGQVTRDEDLENLYFKFEDVVFQTEEGTGRSHKWASSFPVDELFAGSRKETRKEVIPSAEIRFNTFRDPLLGRSPQAGYLISYRTEISTRVALAVSSFLFVLIGAPVGLMGRRGSFMGAGIVALMVAFVLYYPLHEIGKNLAMEKVIPPEIAMAIPGFVVGMIGLVLTIRVVRQ